MQPAYSIEIEKQMQEVFDRLSEKDKRLWHPSFLGLHFLQLQI